MKINKAKILKSKETGLYRPNRYRTYASGKVVKCSRRELEQRQHLADIRNRFR